AGAAARRGPGAPGDAWPWHRARSRGAAPRLDAGHAGARRSLASAAHALLPAAGPARRAVDRLVVRGRRREASPRAAGALAPLRHGRGLGGRARPRGVGGPPAL